MALLAFDVWNEVGAADREAFTMFTRHYTYNPSQRSKSKSNRHQFSSPGQKLILMTPGQDALFVWVAKRYRLDGQIGVNCAVFRNESRTLSSQLIRAAEVLAWEKWPGERLFTFVNPRKVKSRNPGYCFIMAGWRKCGVTKKRKLLIFEKLPEVNP